MEPIIFKGLTKPLVIKKNHDQRQYMCLKITKYNILFLDHIIALFGYNEKKGVH